MLDCFVAPARGTIHPASEMQPPRGREHFEMAHKRTVEEVYQKLSQLDHVLLRPDTYIGSVEAVAQAAWAYDAQTNRMVQRQISFVPGMYKNFDEILVNAAENKQRDSSMTCLKADIDRAKGTISVFNNVRPRHSRADARRPRLLRARAHIRTAAHVVKLRRFRFGGRCPQ
jgi:hypothetical protein